MDGYIVPCSVFRVPCSVFRVPCSVVPCLKSLKGLKGLKFEVFRVKRVVGYGRTGVAPTSKPQLVRSTVECFLNIKKKTFVYIVQRKVFLELIS